MELTNSSDYESFGDRVSESYDTLEMADVNVEGGHLDQEDKLEETEADHKTLTANVKCSKSRIYTGVAVTFIAIFVIAFAVMVYMFVSSNKAGKSESTGYCPKYTANGTVVNTTGSNHGDIIALTCDENSKLIGPHVITCLSTGKWSATPHCKTRTCSSFQLQNMKLESEIKSANVGANVLVNCNEGFVITGNSTVVCLPNETWSVSPTCEAGDCGFPMSIPNAEIQGLIKTTFNSTFVVECHEGYIMSGSTTVRCNTSGHWAVLPTCNKVSCGVPTIPLNSSISHISGTTFQANASLKCDLGFIIRGDPVVTCLANGSWSNAPTCQENDDCIPGVCGSHGNCVDGVNSYKCLCKSGFSGIHCETNNFTDCYDVLHYGNITQDGIYNITTWKTHRQIQVYCDMRTSGGGWTVFQNRFDGSVEFYRNFSEYVNGFGDINGEFWLGLENLHELVSQGQPELRIDVSAANGTKGYEVFQDFDISPGSIYGLHISLGKGTIGDSASSGLSFNNNAAFSTFDHDMDSSSTTHCAESNKGAWWYSACMNVHLNGLYCTPGTRSCGGKGMTYQRFMGHESLLTSRMMFRRV